MLRLPIGDRAACLDNRNGSVLSVMFLIARDGLGKVTGGQSLVLGWGAGRGVRATLHGLGVVPRTGGGCYNVSTLVHHSTVNQYHLKHEQNTHVYKFKNTREKRFK